MLRSQVLLWPVPKIKPQSNLCPIFYQLRYQAVRSYGSTHTELSFWHPFCQYKSDRGWAVYVSATPSYVVIASDHKFVLQILISHISDFNQFQSCAQIVYVMDDRHSVVSTKALGKQNLSHWSSPCMITEICNGPLWSNYLPVWWQNLDDAEKSGCSSLMFLQNLSRLVRKSWALGILVFCPTSHMKLRRLHHTLLRCVKVWWKFSVIVLRAMILSLCLEIQ